jgi:hypothetical protein
MEIKSLSQRIEYVRMESWCLGMIKECLGASSMRLEVPFIAPRHLGAIGGILGRLILPSVGWRTGHCPVHTRQSGAPADRWREPRVACGLRGRPLAQSTVGSLDSPVHHWTVR